MRRIESDIRWQRPVHGGRLHATSWRRSVLLGLADLSEMGTAVPHAASSTRCCRRAVAVSTSSLLEDRARIQHLMRGCAPTRMLEAAASSLTAVHMIITDNKQLGKRCKQFEQSAET